MKLKRFIAGRFSVGERVNVQAAGYTEGFGADGYFEGRIETNLGDGMYAVTNSETGERFTAYEIHISRKHSK